MTRFDEVELDPVPQIDDPLEPPPSGIPEAGRIRRLAALLTDLSLFVALGVVLVPLLPQPHGWVPGAALAGFALMLSYYYFVGTWMLGGQTIGGAIFDVRVVSEHSPAMSLRAASIRWVAVCLSLATAGLGFLLAALPSRRSLPDRMSGTKCI